MRAPRAGVLVTAVFAALLAAAGSASATGSATPGATTTDAASANPAPPPVAMPYLIASSSLAQDGQQLVWHVTLSHSFSTSGLARDGRGLCLALTQAPGGSRSLCVVGAAPHGRHARLRYQPATGAARIVRATVRRSSHFDLTATFMPSVARIAYRSLRWRTLSTLRAPCTARPTATPIDCVETVATGARTLRLHTPRVVGCVPRGPKLVFSGPAHRREIALTFDDGPWPDPPSIDFVRLLHRYHVPATFFEIGEQVPEYDPTGSLERLMLKDGDMIGDHTWTHPVMTSLSAAAQRGQLERTARAIRARTGFTPCLFRPPYGAYDSGLVNLARSLGFTTVQWDVDPVDWSRPGTGVIEQRVISGAHDGAIVLQHFGGGPRYQTYDALPTEIRALRARGYRFVTVTQLLGYRLIYR